MKKIILLILISVFLLSCGNKNDTGVDNGLVLEEVSIDGATNIGNEIGGDMCDTPEGGCEYEFYLQQAIESKTPKSCENLVGEEDKSMCLNMFYFTLASMNKDINYCKSISDKNIALDCENDVYFYNGKCDKISNKDLIQQCEEKEFDSVLFDALEKKDLNVCKTLQDGKIRDACLYEVNILLSSEGGNEKGCDMISSKDTKQNCYDIFYFNTASLSNNIQQCSKIQDVAIQQDCRDTLESIVGNCENISNQSLQNDCLSQKYNFFDIISSRDVKKCSVFAKTSLFTDCEREIYYSLAYEKKDINLCNKISQKEDRELCSSAIYHELALQNTDIKYCEKIVIADIQTECIKSLQ